VGDERDEEELKAVGRDLAAIAAGKVDPYDAGMRLLGASTARVGEAWFSHPLWLLWGGLTDIVDGPADDRVRGDALMVAAASEWLDTPNSDDARRDYFDRWLYDVLGYQRDC
jgi:hypothetical protein